LTELGFQHNEPRIWAGKKYFIFISWKDNEISFFSLVCDEMATLVHRIPEYKFVEMFEDAKKGISFCNELNNIRYLENREEEITEKLDSYVEHS
jgi:hypothetical protein